MADAYCPKHGSYAYRRIWKNTAQSMLIQTCPMCDEENAKAEMTCPYCGKLFSTNPQAVGKDGPTEVPEAQGEKVVKAEELENGTGVTEEVKPEWGKEKKRDLAVETETQAEVEMAGVRVPDGGDGQLGDEDYVPPDPPDV